MGNSILLDSTIYVMAVLFAATLIRSTFGFGEALVAMPLLVLRLRVSVATPLTVLVSAAMAAVIVIQDWRHVQWRSAAGLIAAALPGVPVGVWLLAKGNEEAVKLILGGVIVGFSLYSLLAKTARRLSEDRPKWLLACGFLSGVLGGAYGMNGPPLAVYGTLRRWSPQHFRATLQGYFLAASAAGLAGYTTLGMMNGVVGRYFLVSLPGVMAAIWLGSAMNRRMQGNGFIRVVYGGLLVIGAALVIQAARG